jgi:hypothetical protein
MFAAALRLLHWLDSNTIIKTVVSSSRHLIAGFQLRKVLPQFADRYAVPSHYILPPMRPFFFRIGFITRSALCKRAMPLLRFDTLIVPPRFIDVILSVDSRAKSFNSWTDRSFKFLPAEPTAERIADFFFGCDDEPPLLESEVELFPPSPPSIVRSSIFSPR